MIYTHQTSPRANGRRRASDGDIAGDVPEAVHTSLGELERAIRSGSPAQVTECLFHLSLNCRGEKELAPQVYTAVRACTALAIGRVIPEVISGECFGLNGVYNS